MRRIAIVTTSRADYGIYRHVARALTTKPEVELGFLVSGSHLRTEHGRTIGEIEDDGFPILSRIDIDMTSDAPEAQAAAMSRATAGYGEAFAKHKPDLLLTLGDRLEMLAATIAALPFRLPIAHLHGGELSLGAIDEVIRHAMTKISHLHFVATEIYGRRIAQMGEEPWRITVSGAPALDTLRQTALPDRAALERHIGLSLDEAPLLVTLHPETVSELSPETQAQALLEALDNQTRPIVFTAPNADPGGQALAHAIRQFLGRKRNAVMVESLGNERYFGMMRLAAAMVGNSSSGIIEAASFTLPVVNIGRRQEGRVRAPNVIDGDWPVADIERAIAQALDPGFRAGLPAGRNPYGDGRAGERIAAVLTAVPIGQKLLMKRFVDWEPDRP